MTSMIVDTRRRPDRVAHRTGNFAPSLLQTEDHHLCPGCAHPVAVRLILDVLEQLGLHRNTVAVFGHGCSGTFNMSIDIDVTIALHGRSARLRHRHQAHAPRCHRVDHAG